MSHGLTTVGSSGHEYYTAAESLKESIVVHGSHFWQGRRNPCVYRTESPDLLILHDVRLDPSQNPRIRNA